GMVAGRIPQLFFGRQPPHRSGSIGPATAVHDSARPDGCPAGAFRIAQQRGRCALLQPEIRFHRPADARGRPHAVPAVRHAVGTAVPGGCLPVFATGSWQRRHLPDRIRPALPVRQEPRYRRAADRHIPPVRRSKGARLPRPRFHDLPILKPERTLPRVAGSGFRCIALACCLLLRACAGSARRLTAGNERPGPAPDQPWAKTPGLILPYRGIEDTAPDQRFLSVRTDLFVAEMEWL